MGFVNYEISEAAPSEITLTVSEKNVLVDLYAAGETVTSIKHIGINGKHLRSSYIKSSIKKLKEIEKYMQLVMRGKAVSGSEEVTEYSEDLECDVTRTETTYHAVPSLKGDFEDLIEQKYPTCLVTSLLYLVDKIIDKATTAGTWSAYKALWS